MHTLDPPLVHGNLKTTNTCLTFPTPLHDITEDFAATHSLVKVGDIQLIFATPKKEGVGNINPRWTAPEVFQNLCYTVQSDVYSLGILLWELKYRKMVFTGLGEQNSAFPLEELKEKITSGERPKVDESDRYDRLCAQCWAENPQSRPTIHEIVAELLAICEVSAPILLNKVGFIFWSESCSSLLCLEKFSSFFKFLLNLNMFSVRFTWPRWMDRWKFLICLSKRE